MDSRSIWRTEGGDLTLLLRSRGSHLEGVVSALGVARYCLSRAPQERGRVVSPGRSTIYSRFRYMAVAMTELERGRRERVAGIEPA
jgi:hypothetical protein